MNDPDAETPSPREKFFSGDLPILYRDEIVVVVDKPSGMLVHRGWGRDRQVAMLAVRDQVGRHVYPVHRLDRPTSGVLLFALAPDVARRLQEQFQAVRVEKRYLALVRGVTPEGGVIDHPVPSKPKGPRVPAITEYRRLAVADRFTLVEAIPRTGRLHQIRRHLKHLGHPLIGDVRYGTGELNRHFRARFGLHRLALHAFELVFDHPASGERIACRAPLPADLSEPLLAMGFELGGLFRPV